MTTTELTPVRSGYHRFYWPHASNAEDQPYPKTILTVHVLYRGFQSGALIGALIPIVKKPFTPKSSVPLLPTLLRSTSTGALIGTGLMIPALIARMYGREDIEWNDRSWRLLENTGQIETDFWTVGGGLVGVVGAGVGRQAGVGAVRGVIGGAGLGGLVGLGAMMGKRGLMNKGQPGDW